MAEPSPSAPWSNLMADLYALSVELVQIEKALSSGRPGFANQGQALDGYSALAAFRDVAVRASAALAKPPAGNLANPWKEAVIDALVCAFLLNKENESDPKRALQDLMEWEAQLARDPLINAPAQPQAPSDGVMGAVNWQAIETAPRDGSFFIGANAEEVIVCNWPKQKNIDYVPGNWRKGRGEWNGAFVKTNSPLTHWMPVPELPLPSGEVK